LCGQKILRAKPAEA